MPKKSPITQGRSAPRANPYFISVSGVVNDFTGGGAGIAVRIPKGPTKTCILEYVSAFVELAGAVNQDPLFFLDFIMNGGVGEHALVGTKVSSSAAHPMYIVSMETTIAVDADTDVGLLFARIPPAMHGKAKVQFSCHYV